VGPETAGATIGAGERSTSIRSSERQNKRLPLYALGVAAALTAAGLGVHLVRTLRTPATLPEAHDTAGMPTLFHPARPVPAAAPQPATEKPATEKPATEKPAAKLEPTAQPKPSGQDPTDPTPSQQRPTKSSGPDPNGLTRALRRQRAKLEACFNQHSIQLEGHATTQLLFDLAEDGTQTKVELSPPLLTQTDLGQCLLKVARSTRFPPQPHAVSFAIPLTASTSKQ
jgi:hypothetical protein